MWVETKELYLDLYDALVDDAEYLQSDSDGRNLLPEALIVGALGSVLATFFNSYLGRLGQRAADTTADKAAQLLGRSGRGADRKAVLEALALLEPYLPELRSALEAELRAEQMHIADTLRELGFPASAAYDVAGKVLETLRRSGGNTS